MSASCRIRDMARRGDTWDGPSCVEPPIRLPTLPSLPLSHSIILSSSTFFLPIYCCGCFCFCPKTSFCFPCREAACHIMHDPILSTGNISTCTFLMRKRRRSCLKAHNSVITLATRSDKKGPNLSFSYAIQR